MITFKKILLRMFCLVSLATLNACTGLPKDIQPVNQFDLQRYLGNWYEIARLDHSFERGLTKISADYSVRDDGAVRVLNKGFSIKENEWNTAEGKAYFVDSETQGHLKVSFFGPFYGSYVVFKLDPDYQYAFITSYNKDYLWLLSRNPIVSDAIKDEFIETVTAKGFDVKSVIWVDQE